MGFDEIRLYGVFIKKSNNKSISLQRYSTIFEFWNHLWSQSGNIGNTNIVAGKMENVYKAVKGDRDFLREPPERHFVIFTGEFF